jgi:hypothetical protein
MTNTALTPLDVDALFNLACPTKEDTPFFNHCMTIAKERGLTWEEGLEYTIEMRKQL